MANDLVFNKGTGSPTLYNTAVEIDQLILSTIIGEIYGISSEIEIIVGKILSDIEGPIPEAALSPEIGPGIVNKVEIVRASLRISLNNLNNISRHTN